MKYRIEALENKENYGKSWKKLGVNCALGNAYMYSMDAGNELPNFDRPVAENDISAVIADCRRLGVREFTISTNLLRIKAVIIAFAQLGCKVTGTVAINSRENADVAFIGGELVKVRRKIPAFKMTVV